MSRLLLLVGWLALSGCQEPCDAGSCANTCPVEFQRYCASSCADPSTLAACHSCPVGTIDRASCAVDGGADARD
jgi:hypothetical protein